MDRSVDRSVDQSIIHSFIRCLTDSCFINATYCDHFRFTHCKKNTKHDYTTLCCMQNCQSTKIRCQQMSVYHVLVNLSISLVCTLHVSVLLYDCSIFVFFWCIIHVWCASVGAIPQSPHISVDQGICCVFVCLCAYYTPCPGKNAPLNKML